MGEKPTAQNRCRGYPLAARKELRKQFVRLSHALCPE
jgi:hypothetical protein